MGTEGKFSLPIIHAIREADRDTAKEIAAILKQRTDDVCVLKFAQEKLKESGSLLYCQQRCVKLEAEVQVLLKGLGGNAIIEKIMMKLHADVVSLELDAKK